MDKQNQRAYLTFYPFNFSERSLFASLGSALPLVLFMSCPTKKPSNLVLPFLNDSTS